MAERIEAYIIYKQKRELQRGYVDHLGNFKQDNLTRIDADDHVIVRYIPEVKMQIVELTPAIEITDDMNPGLPLRTN